MFFVKCWHNDQLFSTNCSLDIENKGNSNCCLFLILNCCEAHYYIATILIEYVMMQFSKGCRFTNKPSNKCTLGRKIAGSTMICLLRFQNVFLKRLLYVVINYQNIPCNNIVYIAITLYTSTRTH